MKCHHACWRRKATPVLIPCSDACRQGPARPRRALVCMFRSSGNHICNGELDATRPLWPARDGSLAHRITRANPWMNEKKNCALLRLTGHAMHSLTFPSGNSVFLRASVSSVCSVVEENRSALSRCSPSACCGAGGPCVVRLAPHLRSPRVPSNLIPIPHPFFRTTDHSCAASSATALRTPLRASVPSRLTYDG